ncbi:MAG TPA: multidrug effflux MFS transporter [Burkholderiales bacterium]|nr:multidrug effflux MFS transporter [Burkholderiales bacterium]
MPKASEEPARRSPGPRFLATLASISLINPLAVHMFLPALPVVKAAFGISDALAGVTFSATLFVMAFATLAYGSLSDRHGRRPVLLLGLALFTVGSAASALAPSVPGLIAARVVQALGAGCGVTLARAIARDAYGTERLVKVIAYLTMAYTLGPMIAPLAGGAIIDLYGWRGVFWFAALAGGAIAATAWAVLHETHPRHAAAQRSSGFLRDCVALFSHLRFLAFVLQTGFSTGTFLSMAAAASFLMKDYLGRSGTEFGAYFLLFPAGFLLGNLLASRWSHRFTIESMVLAGSLVTLAAAAAQSALILSGRVDPLVIFVPGFVMSLAQGLALPNAQVGAIRVIPGLAGTAAGIGVFFQMFLGAVFTQAYSFLADGTPTPMVITVSSGALLVLAAGVVPFARARR